MTIQYNPKGVCSRQIHVQVEDGIVKAAQFIGGCSGNTQGIARLVEGMRAEDAIARMEGIRCGNRLTSCPDQLSRALKAALAEEEKRKAEA